MSDGRNYPGDLPRHSVSAGAAVIREDGRVLVIKRRDNGAWVQPGGIVELDEDPRETVVREVFEETGVRVEPETLTGVYKNMVRGVVSLVFRCRIIDGDARPSAEAADVAWLAPDELSDRMAAAFGIRLLDALRDDGPFIRVHDGKDLL
jgi:8-oxo-dGTP diphosphatase